MVCVFYVLSTIRMKEMEELKIENKALVAQKFSAPDSSIFNFMVLRMWMYTVYVTQFDKIVDLCTMALYTKMLLKVMGKIRMQKKLCKVLLPHWSVNGW